jgi:lysozyme
MDKKIISSLISIVILGILIIVARKFIRQSDFEKSTTMYNNFGIRIPNGYGVHGIDVSHYQKGINWELVSQMKDQGVHLEFAIMKSTEGLNRVDKTHEVNWNGAREQGLLCGAYLYFHPNKDVAKQVELFKKHVDLKKGDLAPIIDIEETKGVSDEKLQSQLLDCIQLLKKEYCIKPIIYCNADFYTKHIGASFNKYPLWVAHYKVAKPDIDREWQIWQYADNGNVNGIDGHVDFNVANGSILQLKSLCLN